MMKMPRVWKVLEEFKDTCRSRGWKVSENEDWVEVNDEYHNLLWTRDIHPSSFRKIISSGKCVIRDEFSYHIVEASYTAWLFSETPSETLVKIISDNPNLANRTAIYDLSQVLEGKRLCTMLNNTDSSVFREFEAYLKKDLKVKLRPLVSLSVNSEDFHLVEVA